MIDGYKNIFTEEQINTAKALYKGLSEEQRLWLSGYLAGINQSGVFSGNPLSENQKEEDSDQKTIESALSDSITVLYGTHTGNSKLVAERFAVAAQSKGVKIDLGSLADYKNRKLKEERNLLLVVSTHGEGEPPVSAEDFYGYIFGKKAPALNSLNYSVVALGDSSYINFCQTGKDIYSQLKKLGATNVSDLIELDVDFKDQLDAIFPGLIAAFSSANGSPGVFNHGEEDDKLASPDQWTEAEVLEKILLNGAGSHKETYHIEFDIEDKGLAYEPGDALEVIAKNNKELVHSVLHKLNIDENELVTVANEEITIKEALVSRFELTVLTPQVLKNYAGYAKNTKLDDLIGDVGLLKEYLYGHDFLDLINEYPVGINAAGLTGILRKLPARLYSISSSYDYNPDEVHITVGAVRYQLNEREHNGLCSSFLADDINVGDDVLVRIKKNEGFRLPENDAKVIMVGPGTGIAPFRSFLQQRENDGAPGDNWLFFGDQHFETDFLYQSELLGYRSKGLLNSLDVAFSRDQEDKVYVQHRLREKGQEVYKWLKDGAYVYLCGDKDNMANDVKQELVRILEIHGGLSTEDAYAYFKELRSSKRFQEDVY